MGLPKLSVLLFSRNFDDSGLVDDPGGPVALLHDADDPGLVALLLLNVLEESKWSLSGNTTITDIVYSHFVNNELVRSQNANCIGFL